jgi:hypothetical protein
VVALVTKVNSVAFLLFHVEHLPGVEWFYRWRIVGSYPPEYLVWRMGGSKSPRVVLHSEIPGCLVEVQWRAGADEEWGQAALHECGVGAADFHIKAHEDFIMEKGFRAMANVCGHVSCYGFGPVDLRAGVETTIRGVASGPYPEDVLLGAGEFRPVNDIVTMENVSASCGSLIPCPDKPPVLARIPGMDSRKLYAISAKADRPQSTPLTIPEDHA